MSEQETGPLGQCVYTMSTGRRCQKDATQVVQCGSAWVDPSKIPAYGYCIDHYFAVTKPRDQRIHKTAEPVVTRDHKCTAAIEEVVRVARRTLGPLEFYVDGYGKAIYEDLASALSRLDALRGADLAPEPEGAGDGQ